MSRNWNRYDPRWLVELARQQHPHLPWLAEALASCTRASQESDAYVHFVDPSNANEPGAAWQFDTTLRLTDAVHGELILDILQGHRVGGIEFYDRLR